MTEIIWLDRTDSTNNEAKRIMEKITGSAVIAAKEQTSGRGQRGNVWKTEPYENLTFSLILKFGDGGFESIPVTCQFVISEAVALGIADYLKDNGIKASIKWPNDIYSGDRKICGILIENSVSDSLLKTCIAGIGLNVNQESFPEDLPNPVSMFMLTHRRLVLETELKRLVGSIFRRVGQIYSSPLLLKEDYLSIMYRKDEKHQYCDLRKKIRFTGTIRGINNSALLQVEDAEGRINEFAFKEIEYII